MLPTIMSRGPIDLWTRTPRSIAPFSASAPSHHNLSSADFITNIAESNFWYTQVWMTQLWPSLLGAARVVQPDSILRWHRAGFKAFWRWKSRNRAGRSVPRLAVDH